MKNFDYNKVSFEWLVKDTYAIEVYTLVGMHVYLNCNMLELENKYRGKFYNGNLYFEEEKNVKALIEYLDSLVIVEIMKGNY